METHCSYIPYQNTNHFSRIVLDYLEQSKRLQPFYEHTFNKEGLEESIKKRKAFATNRQVLVEVLKAQYIQMDLPLRVVRNIEALTSESTFTITTAHQPNIFTGPLYFIYKIAHAINLADHCKSLFPKYNFVPVFYMGSEDADLDELNHITINGVAYEWKTNQTGAVGRMQIDPSFIELIHKIEGQLGIYEHARELVAFFKNYYTIGKTIQQATLEIVNALFGEYGLVVVIPDNKDLKRLFNPIIEKELKEQFSYRAVEKTVEQLSTNYKVQANGRALNLFYLKDDKRERIEVEHEKLKVKSLNLEFTEPQILQEVSKYPERFSTNVILRGVFQETILPNIAFIGGGGEIAYWLELKKLFDEAAVPFPVLILRNSFLLITQEQVKKWKKMSFELHDLFQSEDALLNQLVVKEATHPLQLNGELHGVQKLYDSIQQLAGNVDETLSIHTKALQAQAVKRLQELEKKMLRAEKKKYYIQREQIKKMKTQLFPQGNLQERVENFSSYYAKYGRNFIQAIISKSLSLESHFSIIEL